MFRSNNIDWDSDQENILPISPGQPSKILFFELQDSIST